MHFVQAAERSAFCPHAPVPHSLQDFPQPSCIIGTRVIYRNALYFAIVHASLIPKEPYWRVIRFPSANEPVAFHDCFTEGSRPGTLLGAGLTWRSENLVCPNRDALGTGVKKEKKIWRLSLSVRIRVLDIQFNGSPIYVQGWWLCRRTTGLAWVTLLLCQRAVRPRVARRQGEKVALDSRLVVERARIDVRRAEEGNARRERRGFPSDTFSQHALSVLFETPRGIKHR